MTVLCRTVRYSTVPVSYGTIMCFDKKVRARIIICKVWYKCVRPLARVDVVSHEAVGLLSKDLFCSHYVGVRIYIIRRNAFECVLY